MFKRIIAHFLITHHIIYRFFKLKEFNHREINEGISYTFCKFEVWFKVNKIKCTCGKVFLDKTK